MDTSQPILLQLIRATLSTFPALQLAIQQGMGGNQAKEKEQWMANVIHDFILENKPNLVSTDEMTDYVAEILDNEFDTVVEDGSISAMSRNLGHLCRLDLDGRQDEMNQQLTILLAQKQNMQSIFPLQASTQTSPNISASNPTTSASLGRSRQQQQQSNDMEVENNPNTPDPDGWTVVNNRPSNNRKRQQ